MVEDCGNKKNQGDFGTHHQMVLRTLVYEALVTTMDTIHKFQWKNCLELDIRASVTKLLIQTIVFIFMVWYIRFLWSRRRLYWLASKLPGPFALPFIGSAWYFSGNVHETFTSIMMMFNKYPGIFKVWFGPRLFYCVADPKYLEIILPSCLQKEKLYDKVEMIAGQGLLTAPVDKWKRNRKIIAPSFNQKVLDTFIEVFSEQADILVQQLNKHDGKGEFDLFHVISKCTLDIICETAMGVKVNAQTTDALYPKWTDRMLEIVFLRMFVLWYRDDRLFNLFPLGKETQYIRERMHEFSGRVVKEKKMLFENKLKEGNENIEYFDGMKRKVFLDYLLELTHAEGNHFTEEQLRHEVDTFIIAGSDTTATTICFLLTMIGLHQDLQDKVYDEIIDVIGPERLVEADDFSKLKYMERFIKETMRLFPNGGIIARTAENDVDLGDYIIPAGVSIVIGILRTHTNEAYWPDPYKFDPDRFFPEEVAKRPACAYLPFSYGPRNCIGLRYAMMAIKSLTVTILRKYRIYTNYKRVQDIKLQQNLILRAKDGFKVFVERR